MVSAALLYEPSTGHRTQLGFDRVMFVTGLLLKGKPSDINAINSLARDTLAAKIGSGGRV